MTPRPDLVAAAAVFRRDSPRPRAVRIDSVVQPVHVQTVAVMRIRVAHVDVQALARPRPNHGARNPAVPWRLGAVRGHERGGVWLRVVGVEVLAIDERFDSRGEDFLSRNATELVPLIDLAIPPVAAGDRSGASGL